METSLMRRLVRLLAAVLFVSAASDALPPVTPTPDGPQIRSETHVSRPVASAVPASQHAFRRFSAKLLLGPLRSRDNYERRKAAEAAGAIAYRGRAVARGLAARLDDPAVTVRRAGAFSLGRVECADKSVGPALGRAAGDEDLLVRIFAVKGLRAKGRRGSGAILALMRALEDSHPTVRGEAARALGAAGRHAVPAVASLARALKDADEEVREAAAWALGQIGRKAADAAPALIKALQDPARSVRLSAVAALGAAGRGSPNVVPALREALTDESELMRAAAAAALGEVGRAAAPAADDLRAALKDGSPTAQRNAAEALRRIEGRLNWLTM